jgi:hypothetical protein
MSDYDDDVEEFLEHTKFEMFSNEVFVFSSHDQILSLERYGLMNLWLRADGKDAFNAVTVLGY